jgi:hypothetical protein
LNNLLKRFLLVVISRLGELCGQQFLLNGRKIQRIKDIKYEKMLNGGARMGL